MSDLQIQNRAARDLAMEAKANLATTYNDTRVEVAALKAQVRKLCEAIEELTGGVYKPQPACNCWESNYGECVCHALPDDEQSHVTGEQAQRIREALTDPSDTSEARDA